MKNSGNILIGIIAAATAGVVIGMLIAPEKGGDFRKHLKASADDWSKKLAHLMEEGKEQFEGLKTVFGEGAHELKSEANGVKNQISEAFKNAKG